MNTDANNEEEQEWIIPEEDEKARTRIRKKVERFDQEEKKKRKWTSGLAIALAVTMCAGGVFGALNVANEIKAAAPGYTTEATGFFFGRKDKNTENGGASNVEETVAEMAEKESEEEKENLALESGDAVLGSSAIQSVDLTAAAEGTVVYDVSGMVEQVIPSVVAITTTSIYENYRSNQFDPFSYYFGFGGFGNYFGGGNDYFGNSGDSGSTYETHGAGSGIIVGDNGEELWIVTNNHVVSGADELTVTFIDDTTADAFVKGTDSSNDIAVVGVKLDDLKEETRDQLRVAAIGNSDELKLGEATIAIGNALGLGQSVSTGVISAVNREITTSEGNTLTTIQTDAAINPGNSGGALLNAKGELIGINVAKDSATEVEGMGYAIPISAVERVIDRLSRQEKVSEENYPFIGVQLQDISSEVSKTYNIPAGIMVYGVEPNGPAALAGIMPQDVIVSFDGTPVKSFDELQELLQYYPGGTTVTITVKRLSDGAYEEKNIDLTLGFKKDQSSAEKKSAETEEKAEDVPEETTEEAPEGEEGKAENSAPTRPNGMPDIKR